MTQTQQIQINPTLIDFIREQNGATISIDFKRNEIGPTTNFVGYYASFKQFEKTTRNLTCEELENFIKETKDFLLDNTFIGIWGVEDEIGILWYFDVSKWFYDKEEALKFAELEEQIAIWDCRENKAIDIRYS